MASEMFYCDVLKKVEDLTKHRERYLSVQNDKANEIKDLTKLLYDYVKGDEEKSLKSKALPELIVQHFDEEQIWQELELQNESIWTSFVKDVSKCVSIKDNLKFPLVEKAPSEDEVEEEMDALEYDDDSEGIESEEEIEEDEEIENLPKNKAELKDNAKKSIVRKSIVDDKFFKLQDLENFLNIEDKKEAHAQTKSKINNGLESDSDEEIDFFEDAESEESDEADEDNEIKYGDFFDRPDDDGENYRVNERNSEDAVDDDNLSEDDGENDLREMEETDQLPKEKKSVKFNLGESSDDNDSDSGAVDKSTDPTEKLSEYQLRQQRLLRKIDHLENKNLSEKTWQMKGEVDAKTRPQNSLLEEVVDFDMTTRPAPIITEETTFKLEDIIKQRIKDKVWDDVERKAKPTDEPREFKKKLILDQEKSKSSLAQVYEQEYIKQREGLNPYAEKTEEEPKEHQEIKKDMEELFAKLDALSNYHYTPKVAVPEVKIISNIPAISMEEVAPIATSDAALLAPEEVKGKRKGTLMAKSERTDTDKKRERRKKKIFQKEREKEKEKREKRFEKSHPGFENKYSKEKAAKLLHNVSNDRNTKKMIAIDDNKALKSSKSFFTQLQDNISSSATGVKPSKKKKDTLPAKKYKL